MSAIQFSQLLHFLRSYDGTVGSRLSHSQSNLPGLVGHQGGAAGKTLQTREASQKESCGSVLHRNATSSGAPSPPSGSSLYTHRKNGTGGVMTVNSRPSQREEGKDQHLRSDHYRKDQHVANLARDARTKKLRQVAQTKNPGPRCVPSQGGRCKGTLSTVLRSGRR